MTALLLALLLGGPGTIRVAVQGAEGPVEVVAVREGAILARASGAGTVLLEGLPEGAYDLRATAPGLASTAERGVRAVTDGAPGFDALLVLRRAFPVEVATDPGATLWSGGFPQPAMAALLPAGIHAFVIDHHERVSSAERLLRLDGPTHLEMPLDGGMVVTGRVLGPDGAPLPGARVEVYADGYATRRFTLTGADGGFGLAGFRGTAVSLHARAAGCADALRRLLFFPGEERTNVEIALSGGSAVRLRSAPDAEATLLPRWFEESLDQARLRAHYEPVRRSPGPGFLFTGLTPGREYRILLTRPGGEPHSTAPFVAPAAGQTLELPPVPLPQASSLQGRVDGALPALFGRIVECRGPEGTLTCRTDRAGRFRFDGLERGRHDLLVREADCEPRVVEVAGSTEVTLTCAAALKSLHGLVLSAEGKPLADVIVTVAGREALSDAQGAFGMDNLPDVPLRVSFVPAPGSAAFREDPHLPHVEEGARPGSTLRVRLLRAGTLRATLESPSRLARAAVRVEGTEGVRLVRRLPRGATAIEIPDLPTGNYSVEVIAPGLWGTNGAMVIVGEPATVRVIAGRAVRGRVVTRRLAGSGEVLDVPCPRAWVVALDADPARFPEAVTPVDEDGSFLLGGLPDGPILLAACAPGFPPCPVRVEAEDREVLLPLYEPAEAGVVVTDAEGNPLGDALLRVYCEGGPEWTGIVARTRFLGVLGDDEDLADFPAAFRVLRDDTGWIRIPWISPGSWRFQASREGFVPATVGVRALSASAIGRLEGAVPHTARDRAPRLRLQPR